MELDALGLGLAAQDGDLGLEVGRADVGDQAPFEAAPQPLLQRLDVLGRGVAGEDDLLLRAVERVEGVEELLLHPLLVGQELNVVGQQHVDRAVLLAEARGAVEADRVDQLVDELLGRQVLDLQPAVLLADVVPDGVQQVGLAQAHAAVEEERVVAAPGLVGDGARGGVGELVRVADHEGVELVARLERRDPRRGADAARRAVADREQHLVRRALQIGDGAIHHRPVDLFERGDEALIRSAQDEPALTLRLDGERAEPGAELFRR